MAHKKKEVFGNNDLRRLMKEKQSSLNNVSRKIESPLARYNLLGQLSCVLCNAPVKNNLLWNVHTQGRTHKESLARLKAEKDRKEHAFVEPADPVKTKKRKLNDEELLAIARGEKSIPVKKQPKKDQRSRLPSDGFDNGTSLHKKPRSILKTSSVYEEQNSEAVSNIDGSHSDLMDVQPTQPIDGGSKVSVEPGLPSDFFDDGIVPSAPADSSGTQVTKEPIVMSEQLPEGFFDDPKMDAKVRKVEYKDKMEEEWEMFQRAMKEEHHVSEVIVAEDDEEANEERNLVEVEEQLKKWSKIDELAKQKEQLMSLEKEYEQNTSSNDEATEEQDFDELLDWRSKKAWQ